MTRLAPRTLQALLVRSFLAAAILPALLVGGWLAWGHWRTIKKQEFELIQARAQTVKRLVEEHLMHGHLVLDAVVTERISAEGQKRVEEWIATPQKFAPVAFSAIRSTPQVPAVYFAVEENGDFFGVAKTPQGMRTSWRGPRDIGRRVQEQELPGAPLTSARIETENYEPRTRPWYVFAAQQRKRAFTQPYANFTSRLTRSVVTLVQPVFTGDELRAVFALDLFLDDISQKLAISKVTPNSVSYVVDEAGKMIATSAEGKIHRVNVDVIERLSPLEFAHPYVRSSSVILRNPAAHQAAFVGKGLYALEAQGSKLYVSTERVGEQYGLNWRLVVAAPRADFDAGMVQSLKSSMILGLLAVGAFALASLYIAQRLTRRFRRLELVALQLGRGERIAPPAPKNLREIENLHRALYDSSERIAAYREQVAAQAQELEQHNAELEARVVKRTEQLEASRQEALAAAKAKSAFLATMSHEIRTPLNGVVGMTALMADTPLDDEQRDYLHTMRVSSDQLLNVINDVLDFSKIESGRLELEREALSLRNTIEEACDIAGLRAREKGLEVLIDLDEHLPEWVLGDVTRLRQVLLNFLNNAVKFTEQGHVLITAFVREPASAANQGHALFEFQVTDTGIGIPAEKQGRLFESFSQVDASTTRKYGGSGLGLAICKRLAEVMGGEVGVRSEAGKGSTFWFTARLEPTAMPESSRNQQAQFESLAHKRVLVVDDTPINIRILQKQLERWQVQVLTAQHAYAALDVCKAQGASGLDAIITDMHMPDADGLELAQQVRALGGAFAQLPIILLTSGAMPPATQATMFQARMLKPYRQGQLFDTLVRTLHPTQQVATARAEEDAVAQRNKAVLVVDDNPINLKVASGMLAKLGYEADTAENGRLALDKVAQSLKPDGRPYALVLMDVNMPEMDGLQATQLIAQTHGASAPPVVALTASVLESDRKRCLEAGMCDFVAKPMRMGDLTAVLEQWGQSRTAGPISPEPAQASTGIEPPPAPAPTIAVQGQALAQRQADVALMDWSRLEQFKAFDDEQLSMTREIIALFVSDSPQRVADIQAALQTGEPHTLSRAAHALKGAASNIGAAALTQACGQLEQDTREAQWPANAPAQVAAIAHAHAQTLQALQAWTA